MINHKHKFIFTRVTKTASSAMLYSLKKCGVEVNKVVSDDDWEQDPNHVPMPRLKKSISDEEFNSYFKWGFVRNPWDRWVSAYYYSLSWFKKNKPEELTEQKFKNFNSWTHYNDETVGKYGGKYGLQWKYVRYCDFIGKFENLQEDFNIVCDKIGITKQQLPHKNKSKHKHYTKYYDDETKQIVAERYAKDIETFGYEFGK